MNKIEVLLTTKEEIGVKYIINRICHREGRLITIIRNYEGITRKLAFAD
jgi:hypothetical protein